MKLEQLKLQNFKGIKSFTLDTQGENVSIMGDNATGKTSIYDAFLWLLFDKDSQSKKDFEIKTLNAAGEALHGLEHSVEGVFEVDGKELALKKTYAEKWTKKRGSAEKQFTGHTVDHFIDKVPVKKAEFDNRIKTIIDEEAFKLLTNPKQFTEQLHWQDRRRILIDVCGDVSDEEVIASDTKLAKLPKILSGRKLEDHRKVIAARRTEINRELEKIPVRIDEVTQGLPDISAVDRSAHENAIKLSSSIVESKEARLRELEAGRGTAELTEEIAKLNAKIIDLKTKAQEEAAFIAAPDRKEKARLSGELYDLESAISGFKREIERAEGALPAVEARMAELRQKWHQKNEESFTFTEEDTCPTCGQSLPADQVTAAREKALNDFNQVKAEQLATISKGGQRAKIEAEELKQVAADKRPLMENAEAEAARVKAALEALTARLESEPKPEVNPELEELLAKKSELENKLSELKVSRVEAVAELKAEIDSERLKLRVSEAELAKFERYAAGQKRIEELKAQERELASEFEELEQELYLTEQFVRAKVALLEDLINSRFELARFKLFNVQINGGLEEVCETIYNGVPYSSLNSGARINIGLDIINTLSGHYGFNAPIFIDNAESVTAFTPVKAQVIHLVVSEKDAKLRVEAVAQKSKGGRLR